MTRSATCEGPSANQSSRIRSRSRSGRHDDCSSGDMHRCARPPRGRHASLDGRSGVAIGPFPPGCRASRRSRPGSARGSGEGRGSPAAPAASRRKPRSSSSRSAIERVSSATGGPSTGRSRMLALHCRALARLRIARVDEQPVEPGVEPIRIAEPGQLAPGDHQRLLHGILGSADVAEDPLGDREESVRRVRARTANASRSPALGLLDEIAIHQACPSLCAQMERVPRSMSGRRLGAFNLLRLRPVGGEGRATAPLARGPGYRGGHGQARGQGRLAQAPRRWALADAR